jgi:UDP-N-acetylglucosamine 1-carboxyvinyltransferase
LLLQGRGRGAAGEGGVTVRRTGALKAVDMQTAPFPGFRHRSSGAIHGADELADGASMIRETIFENRFMHAPELSPSGRPDIDVRGNEAVVRGPCR